MTVGEKNRKSSGMNSVDDILNLDNEDIVSTEPKESYVFNFSVTELDGIFRFERKNICKRPVIAAIICILALISTIDSSFPQFGTGFLMGVFIVTLFTFINELRRYDKFCKNTIPRIADSTYEYQLYEDYVNINIYRNNEKTHQVKCYYKDIEKVHQYDNWLFLQICGQGYIVRKSDLKENSAFYTYMYNNPSKTVARKTPSKLRTASIILFVASIMSIFGALLLWAVLMEINGLMTENMWTFFLMTPIPIASIVFGFVMKSKGYKYKKNVIVGIIMTAVLCIYGSFTFIFSDVYDNSDTPVIETEQTIGIDIPEYKSVSTQNMSGAGQTTSREQTCSKSDIAFDNTQVENFEKQLKTDERWLSSVPNNLIGIMSHYRQFTVYDYALVYNTDTAEFNTLPENEGTYHFINVFYNSEVNRMEIIEYDIDFVK